MSSSVSRRRFIQGTALTMGTLAMGPGYWRQALAHAPATATLGPYGALGAPDALGLALPQGFRSRLIAAAGTPVAGTAYPWPLFPDGAATYAQPDGGYVLAVNSEVPSIGGASSISFDRDGRITGARRILSNTSTNCGGGATPWGTWLSCEEIDTGITWECDPTGAAPAVARPALGVFKHEAACVDPVGERLYLTEDVSDSGFYRFTPDRYPDLSAGTLEIATAGPGGRVTWVALPDPLFTQGVPTRRQVPDSLRFRRGEGLWFDSGVVYFSTTGDDRVWAYECATERLENVYDAAAIGPAAPLRDPDNLTVHAPSGDLFVCEDADNLEVCLLTPDREIAPFLRASGPLHAAGTELAGATFDPSGQRLYVSSQRGGLAGGLTFEVSGPFRRFEGAERPVLGPAPLLVPLALRAKPRMRVATLRRDGLLVSLDADRAATARVRLTARRAGRTLLLAEGTRRLTRAGNVKVRLRVPASVRERVEGLTGREVRATLTATLDGRRVTRPIVLTRGR